jgi:hypothetical protein
MALVIAKRRSAARFARLCCPHDAARSCFRRTSAERRAGCGRAGEVFPPAIPNAVVLEDGKALFDMRAAKYSLTS